MREGQVQLEQDNATLTALKDELNLLKQHLQSIQAALDSEPQPSKKELAALIEQGRQNGLKHVMGQDKSLTSQANSCTMQSCARSRKTRNTSRP